MTGYRSARIRRLIAEQAARRGGQMSAADACLAVVASVEVTGAWLLAARREQPGHLIQVTDETSEWLAELQLTLGEGPGLDAAASGGPVLTADLGLPQAERRWPAFAPAARQAGAAAIFVFPLQLGAIRAGVMGLYRTRAGPLSEVQLVDALLFADSATLLLLEAADHSVDGVAAGGPPGSGPGGQTAELSQHRAMIDQATGMLTEQLGVGIAEAFIRLRAYAYARDRGLSDLASDIVARRLRLRPDPDPHKDEQALPRARVCPCGPIVPVLRG